MSDKPEIAETPEENTSQNQPDKTPDLPQREDGTYVDFADVAKVNPELAKRAEKRIAYMNARMKSWETQALDQAKLTKHLLSRLDKLETGDIEERIERLQTQKQEAYESGDLKKVAELDDELLEHKLAVKSRKPVEVKEPEFPEEPEQPLSDDQMALLASWAKETDDKSGTPLRPWAHPDHPDQKKAIRYIEAAAMDPDYDVSTPEGFKAILETVDRKMSRGKQPGTPAVLSANGDGRPRSGSEKLKVTPEMARVAEGMGYTPEAYAKLMQNIKEK